MDCFFAGNFCSYYFFDTAPNFKKFGFVVFKELFIVICFTQSSDFIEMYIKEKLTNYNVKIKIGKQNFINITDIKKIQE